MRNRKIENTKVGLLVLSGLVFLILTLYVIGKNRNLLGKTFTIKAVLNNVNGLVPGNNVRFKGIDVGTVKSITVENDSAIYVVMTIDKSMKAYIKQNAIASIGTDGLMGNKLININSSNAPALPVEENDVIQSRKPVETDEMLRTLNTTNENIERITNNLYEISVKLNNSQSLWTFLSDSVMARDFKMAIVDFREAGSNTQKMTASANRIVHSFENGDGIAHRLFSDTTMSGSLTSSIHQIEIASKETSAMMKDLKKVVDDMKQGEGTAGLLIADTALRQSLYNSALNIEEGTGRFNQNMEAMKSNFLFRGYFRRMEKEAKKNASASSN